MGFYVFKWLLKKRQICTQSPRWACLCPPLKTCSPRIHSTADWVAAVSRDMGPQDFCGRGDGLTLSTPLALSCRPSLG